MFIDTHCHIDELSEEEIIKYIENAKRNKVEKMIISAVDLETSMKVVEISNRYDNLYCTIGIHPNNIENIQDNYISVLEKLAINSKVIGIGEIGLDFFYGRENISQQVKIFEQHLLLAEKLQLPVIIHNRNANQETLEIVKKHNLRGVFHCFSSDLNFAKEIININYKLGIGGIITFKNSNLRDVIKGIDIEHLLLETDSPYLSPEPKRGQNNESANIKFIAEEIAKIKDKTIDFVAQQTTTNALTLFDFSS